MKKLFTIIICVLMAVSAYFYSCQKTNPHEDSGVTPKATTTNKNVFKKAGGTACVCDPGYINPNCPQCIQGNFMFGKDVFTYTVNWESCSTQDPNGCYMGGVQTHLTFCYAPPAQGTHDCNLQMSIDSLPPCIECSVPTYPYCQQMKTNCSKTGPKDYTVTLDYTDPITQLQQHVDVTITQDPKVTWTCTDSHGYKHTCTGNMF